MRLYLKYLSIHLRSAMEYKSSFIMSLLGQFFVSFTFLVSVSFMFIRFHAVEGFTFQQVLLCFSVVQLSASIAECFFSALDGFSTVISNSEFDRIMVRPRNEMFQVLASRVNLKKFGGFLQALVILIYAVPASGIDWTWVKILLLFFMLLSGIAVFAGLFMIYAALCFFTIEGLEFMNIFTDGGKEFGSYPIKIYGNFILKFFTFFVPIAMFQYYPFLYLTELSNHWYYAAGPAYGFLFLLPCWGFWKIGVRHYKSTGS